MQITISKLGHKIKSYKPIATSVTREEVTFLRSRAFGVYLFLSSTLEQLQLAYTSDICDITKTSEEKNSVDEKYSG